MPNGGRVVVMNGGRVLVVNGGSVVVVSGGRVASMGGRGTVAGAVAGGGGVVVAMGGAGAVAPLGRLQDASIESDTSTVAITAPPTARYTVLAASAVSSDMIAPLSPVSQFRVLALALPLEGG